MEDKRRRHTILMIAATMVVGLALGYIYSYHSANLKLMEKHTVLNYQMKNCASIQKKCTGNLRACASANRDAYGSRRKLESALSNEQNNYNTLKGNVDSINTKLTKAFKFYANVSGIMGIQIEEQEVEDEKAMSLVAAVKQFKDAHKEYVKLRNDYNTLAKDKLTCIQQSKSVKNTISILESENKVLEAKLRDMKMGKSNTVTEVNNEDKVKIESETPKQASKKDVEQKKGDKTATTEAKLKETKMGKSNTVTEVNNDDKITIETETPKQASKKDVEQKKGGKTVTTEAKLRETKMGKSNSVTEVNNQDKIKIEAETPKQASKQDVEENKVDKAATMAAKWKEMEMVKSNTVTEMTNQDEIKKGPKQASKQDVEQPKGDGKGKKSEKKNKQGEASEEGNQIGQKEDTVTK